MGLSLAAPGQASPVDGQSRWVLRARGQHGEILRPRAHASERPARNRPLVIPRARLRAELARGIGRFLQQVQVEPKHLNGRFVGWRVLSLFEDRGDVRVYGLAPGDVVTRINGLPIERPEQFMEVWEQLATARAITLQVERAGRPDTLRIIVR